MIYISFVEILQQSQVYLIHAIGPGGGVGDGGQLFYWNWAITMVDNLFPDHIDPELLAHNSHTPSPAVSDEALVLWPTGTRSMTPRSWRRRAAGTEPAC
ncbi:MAG: hypothetical protein R2857_10210 [Vampirovibrionales bacterium]